MGNRTTEKPAPPLPRDHMPAKQARRGSVPVLFSEDAAERLRDAEVALAIASDEDRAAAPRVVDAARAEVQKATVVFRFQAIGQPAYQALQAKHPPSDEEMAAYEKEKAEQAALPIGERAHVEPPIVNGQTWPPALIAASLLDPVMTEDEVVEELGKPEWNTREVQELYDTALAVNTTMRRVSAGKGSGSTRR